MDRETQTAMIIGDPQSNETKQNFEFVKKQLKTIDSNFGEIMTKFDNQESQIFEVSTMVEKHKRKMEKLIHHYNRVVNNVKQLNYKQAKTQQLMGRLLEIIVMMFAVILVFLIIQYYL
jgi:DNA repair ATPase RecN